MQDRHPMAITSLVITWVLLIPMLFFATRGAPSFDRVSYNNSISYSSGTLTSTEAGSYFMIQQSVIYGIISIASFPFLSGVLKDARLSRYGWLAPLPIWALVSGIWSQSPLRTLAFAILIFLLSAFGIYITRRFAPEQQMSLLMVVGWAVLFSSYVLALFYPAAGIAQFDGHGAWQGVFTHKNHCAFATLYLMLPAFFRKSRTLMDVCLRTIYIFASIGLIIMTQSRTGWLLLAGVLLFVAFTKVLCRIDRAAKAVVLLAALTVVACTSLLFVNYLPQIALLLGKPTNLSGRTGIWRAILPVLWKRPILGFGYQAFWLGLKGESGNLEILTGYLGLSNAENSVLQIWLELGLVGVALMALMFFRACRNAIACLVKNPSPHTMLNCSIIFLSVLGLVDGDKIMFPHTLEWLLFVVAFIGLADQARSIKTTDGGGPKRVESLS